MSLVFGALTPAAVDRTLIFSTFESQVCADDRVLYAFKFSYLIEVVKDYGFEGYFE